MRCWRRPWGESVRADRREEWRRRSIRAVRGEVGASGGSRWIEGARDGVRKTGSDTESLVPAVSHHKVLFGRAPRLVATDRGFWSAQNEADAIKLGVKIVAIPKTGKLSRTRSKKQRTRSFRRAQAWRAGGESRIGTLKHRYGMNRAMSKGDAGHKRDVGWSVITNNLVSIARWTLRQEWRAQDEKRA